MQNGARHFLVADQIVEILPQLRAFAYRFERSAVDAEDLAQDVVVNALAHADQFREGTSFKNWVYTIMRNAFYARYHQRKRYPLRQSGDAATIDVPVASTQEWALYMSDVRAALATLAADRRAALLMIADGETYQSVADTYGCQMGTVKSRIARARTALVSELGEIDTSEAAKLV
jgi:RNA polymerase sigma-70 factor (ECF subfamily)